MYEKLHLKALVFLYAFEESVDCHLLSSFCDDSNSHLSLFKYVLSTMGVTLRKSTYLHPSWKVHTCMKSYLTLCLLQFLVLLFSTLECL